MKYADDDYLADAAVRGLVSTPGSEEAVLSLMQNAPRPSALLAYAASKRPSEGAEEILLSWLTDYQTDDATKEAVYNALAACGGKSSLRTLADAAAASDYDFGKTDATSAYIRLVNRLADEGDTKSALAAARSLAKATARTNVRARRPADHSPDGCQKAHAEPARRPPGRRPGVPRRGARLRRRLRRTRRSTPLSSGRCPR